MAEQFIAWAQVSTGGAEPPMRPRSPEWGDASQRVPHPHRVAILAALALLRPRHRGGSERQPLRGPRPVPPIIPRCSHSQRLPA